MMRTTAKMDLVGKIMNLEIYYFLLISSLAACLLNAKRFLSKT